jgi:hydrogenase 3 maturation protease
MQNLKITLTEKLKGAKKIAVLGIGSTLRNDDIAGILVAEELKKTKNLKMKIFLGSTAPENLTGEIIKYEPTHIIIIDSVDAEEEPGSVFMIDAGKTDGVSFSSHMLPIKIMVDYLLNSLKCEITVIGIQPKNLEFGENVSMEVKKSAKLVSIAISRILR